MEKGRDIMIRGTTAQFKFSMPYEVSQLKHVTVKFWQPGYDGPVLARLPIIKEFDSPIESDNPYEITVTLTSEETARFSDQLKARVQLKAETISGGTFASHREYITVYPMDDDMIGEIPPEPSVTEDGLFLLDGGVISNGGDI
jgi:hypothetical protein